METQQPEPFRRFIGVKVIEAYPCKAWQRFGEYPEGSDGYRVVYPDDYISWSPASVFEEAYRPADAMSFGLAVEALKKGFKVARAGWNGKGMWLSLSGPLHGRSIPASAFWSQNNADYAAEQPNGEAQVLPCITMKTADGKILMGWLASQTDILADDWLITEGFGQ